MLKLMGKKILMGKKYLQFYTEIFCLTKPMKSIRILQNLSSAASVIFPLTWLTHKKVINTLITFHLADLLFVNHGWQSLSCILDNHTRYPGGNIFSYIAYQK